MNKENLKQWLDALRSGEYKQAGGILRDNADAFCCLGVGCEVAGPEVVPVSYREHSGVWTYGAIHNTGLAPVEFMHWLGLSQDKNRGEYDPDIDWGDEIGYLPLQSSDDVHLFDFSGLASLNDAGFTFSQIADLIEYFGLVEEEV